MNLGELKIGQRANIVQVHFGVSTLRIMELGMVVGAEVRLLAIAPTGEPLAFQIGESVVSLRKSDAAVVKIELLV